MSAPSGWAVEQAMSAWQSARARLLADDPDLAGDEAALAALLGPEGGDVRDVMGRLLGAVQHAAQMAAGAGDMIAALVARERRYKARSEAARGTLFAMMDALGSRREEFPHGTVSIASGRAAAVITDEAALPDRFVETVTVRKVKRAELLTALKDGEVIDGAELTNGLPTLTIRGK